MAETDDAGASRREPWLLAVFGGLIGIALAVALVVFGGLGGSGTASASSSPTALVSPSGSLTAEGSPSTAPTDTLPPTPEVTLAPPTTAPTKPPTPTPTPNTRPAITKFSIPSVVDCTVSAPIHVSWTIRNATGVTLSIEGGGIYRSYSGTSGSDDVPFGCEPGDQTKTYTLRTTGGSGPAATITKSVKWGAMQIVSFSMSATANCPNFNQGTTVGVNLNYEVKYATGAQLKRDGVARPTPSGKIVHTTTVYDCTQHNQDFTLTTTGGYGTPAMKTFTVNNALG